MIELRSQPAGHPNYRRVVQEMYRQIAESAGHHAVAEMMAYVDLTDGDEGRQAAERALEARRAGG